MVFFEILWSDAIKTMTKNNNALILLQKEFSDLGEWLKPLCRFNKVEDFVIADYKEKRLRLTIYTKDHSYHISAVLPDRSNFAKIHGDKGEYDDGYLGCISKTRKQRAGEDWNRGNDLADGSYSRETFEAIVNDIVAYELVKVAKPKSRGAYINSERMLNPSNDSSDELNAILKDEPSMKPYLPTEPKEIEIVKNLLPEQKVGDTIGFRQGRRHYTVVRDE